MMSGEFNLWQTTRICIQTLKQWSPLFKKKSFPIALNRDFDTVEWCQDYFHCNKALEPAFRHWDGWVPCFVLGFPTALSNRGFDTVDWCQENFHCAKLLKPANRCWDSGVLCFLLGFLHAQCPMVSFLPVPEPVLKLYLYFLLLVSVPVQFKNSVQLWQWLCIAALCVGKWRMSFSELCSEQEVSIKYFGSLWAKICHPLCVCVCVCVYVCVCVC